MVWKFRLTNEQKKVNEICKESLQHSITIGMGHKVQQGGPIVTLIGLIRVISTRANVVVKMQYVSKLRPTQSADPGSGLEREGELMKHYSESTRKRDVLAWTITKKYRNPYKLYMGVFQHGIPLGGYSYKPVFTEGNSQSNMSTAKLKRISDEVIEPGTVTAMHKIHGKINTPYTIRYSYNNKTVDKNSEANGHLKIGTTHKTRKENLKPRKIDRDRVQFIQGNLQKSQTGQIELNKRISKLNKEEENFVCLIQEPYSSRSRIIYQPNSVHKFATKGLARAAVYVSKTIPAWFIENLSSKDLVAVQIRIGQQDVLIVSAYMDITINTLETPDFVKVLDFANDRGLGMVIGMDSNCHSTLFGPKQNQRGHLFDELISNNNLTIENVGHSPTYESRGNKTCIDVTLTRGLRQTIKDWVVDRDYNGSDHNYI